MKYKKYIIAASFSLAVISCKKSELDLQPFNQIETSSVFNTETDVTLAINGMYNGLRGSATNPYYVAGTHNILADVLADNLILSSTGRQTLVTMAQWQYNGETMNAATVNVFRVGYLIIRRANAILENINKLPAGAFRDNARGEALAIRAMVHFDIARMYSKTFENATATDSTVAYVTSTDPTLLPTKEPVRNFYPKIVTDLTQALPLINTSNGNGRLNKAAVNGLLSRVYLYSGDFANCITASNAALGTSPVLPSITDFPRIWTDETNNGVLFKVLNTTLDNSNGQGVNYFQTIAAGVRSEYVVDFNFRQLFLPSDIRTNTYIQTSPFNGVNQNHVIKYRQRAAAGSVAGVVDAKVLRTAEVLLNRAEAYQRSGNDAAALADLNLLKTNRYTGFTNIVGLTGASLLNEIYNERRLELAFEGDRFWDLKRRNQPVVRDGTKGDRADGTGVVHLFTRLNVGDHRFQLPFPSAETNFNIGFKQNPGY